MEGPVRHRGAGQDGAEPAAAERQPGQRPANAAQNSNAIPGLSQIGDFFGALGQANTWIRVAKVIVGGVLLIVGLVHITGADNAVASVARKVPLPI